MGGALLSETPARKRYLRAEVLSLRDGVDAAVWSAADARIRANLQELPIYQEAQTVFCYISTGSEVDTLWLVEEMLASGKTVCAPRCVENGIMYAHVMTSLDSLEEGVLGILHPAADSPVINPEDIELAIVPCLSCDRRGYRLGYGGGYYDRYLATAPQAVKAVLCREGLLVATLPSEPHDVLSDLIVTDKEVITVNQPQ